MGQTIVQIQSNKRSFGETQEECCICSSMYFIPLDGYEHLFDLFEYSSLFALVR